MTDPRWIRYVLLLERTGKPLTREALHGHIKHLRALEKAGRLVLCGPFSDHPGGMVVVKAGSKAQAEEDAQADPFVSGGFHSYSVRTWELSCEENQHLGAAESVG